MTDDDVQRLERSLLRLEERVRILEIRLAWFTGLAAAIGGLAGSLISGLA